MTFPMLSFLIWFPIAGGCYLFTLRKPKEAFLVRSFALFITLVCLGASLQILRTFDFSTWKMQWVESIACVPTLNIYYTLGIDGFSLPLIILTCLMGLIVVLASFHSVKKQVASYVATFLIMQGLMCGVFCALDAIVFYTFWEAMLIPMFLIIGVWGGKNRVYASIKFFLYTFLGSVLLLIALIYLQILAIHSSSIEPQDVFNILSFQQLPLDFTTQKWLFLGFVIAFAVKVPMWPVHTWLPDAHVEAPTGGSVILAAILLKVGGYGFIRFILPILPDASQAFASGMIGLALVAIVYVALVALMQKDMKKLIAYSSISHMGFVILGFFVVYPAFAHPDQDAAMSIEGAMVQMISHGFISAALFLCVGVLYDRMHTRMIRDYGGVAHRMPIFAAFFMFFAMANVGLPGTSGFVGEFLVILGAFKAKLWYAMLAASILILGASYTLWMYKRVLLGPIEHEPVFKLQDITGFEKSSFFILALMVLALGLYPGPLLDMMHVSVQHLLEQMLASKV